MRGSTHIESHRGPTNIRVRCHLGVKVPDGDCAIRMGEEIRRWKEGKCLVFDDYFDFVLRHYFATKPASVIRLLLSVSSSSRNLSMSLPVRKIGFSACFSMYSLYSAVCVTLRKRST